VETSYEVAGEPQLVDVYFVPSNPPASSQSLGVLGRIVQAPCLLEPYRNQPSTDEVYSCLLKLLQVHGDYRRQARRGKKGAQIKTLPYLWILASSASKALLNGFGASPNEDWGSGIYFLAPSLRTVIVAINQLSCTEETLWLRLLGKGQTQQQAISEVLSFNTEDKRRSSILRLLANWKVSVEITGQAEAEKELMMALSQAYLEWEQQTEQRGRQEGELLLVLRLLNRRLGSIPFEAEARIRKLSLSHLEALGEALLDFTDTADLDGWMRSQNID
jgi:Domain of unknown function (DUF4351)